MKSVGKPDAANPHVRVDERGRETERLAKPQAAATFLNSTIPRNNGLQNGCSRRGAASPRVFGSRLPRPPFAIQDAST